MIFWCLREEGEEERCNEVPSVIQLLVCVNLGPPSTLLLPPFNPKAERYRLQETPEESEVDLKDWLALIDAIYMSFDLEALVPIAEEQQLQELEQQLQVCDMGVCVDG